MPVSKRDKKSMSFCCFHHLSVVSLTKTGKKVGGKSELVNKVLVEDGSSLYAIYMYVRSFIYSVASYPVCGEHLGSL